MLRLKLVQLLGTSCLLMVTTTIWRNNSFIDFFCGAYCLRIRRIQTQARYQNLNRWRKITLCSEFVNHNTGNLVPSECSLELEISNCIMAYVPLMPRLRETYRERGTIQQITTKLHTQVWADSVSISVKMSCGNWLEVWVCLVAISLYSTWISSFCIDITGELCDNTSQRISIPPFDSVFRWVDSLSRICLLIENLKLSLGLDVVSLYQLSRCSHGQDIRSLTKLLIQRLVAWWYA